MIGLIITALLFPIAGCIAGRRPLPECFLFGVGIVGAAMFVLGLFHVPFVFTIVLVVVAGLLGFLVSEKRGGQRPSAVQTAEGGCPPPLATVAMIVPLALLAIPTAIVPLKDFDGRVFWLLKAKALANERAIDGPFFHNQVVDSPRNQYPLLIPLDAAAIMIASGDTDDRQLRWLYLFTFAALVFLVSRKAHPWCGAILAWTPQFATNGDGGALSAYSDIAFAAFLAAAFFELIDARSPVRFGMWLSFLALTKSEGLPIDIVLISVAIGVFRTRITRALFAPAIATTALIAWRLQVPRTDEENFLVELPTLPTRLHRLVPAIFESAKHFFFLSSWGLLWIAPLIAIVVLARRKEWLAPATVVGVFAVYIAAYMVTVWPVSDLVNASVDRLLMHMIGPALFAIAHVTDASAQNRYSPPEYSQQPA